jgi:excisionase family DNA binding protein
MENYPTPKGAAGWLGVGRAAQYLGVSEPTLRKWTDTGQLSAFRTPGGHRRYQLRELDLFRERHLEHAGLEA